MGDYKDTLKQLLDSFSDEEIINAEGQNEMERKISVMNSYIERMEKSGLKPDATVLGLRDLLMMSSEYGQSDLIPDERVETTKVFMIRTHVVRKAIEKQFKINTVGVYGVGLFLPIEGILLPETYKNSCGYTFWSEHNRSKSAKIDLSDISDEYRKDLIVPAKNGLFIPKKSDFLDKCIGHAYQLRYFDPQ